MVKKFATAINCMDGRTQMQVNRYLRDFFSVDVVDTVTEPGPDGILASQTDPVLVDSILKRVAISVDQHGSQGIAVVGHHDCAGNPVEKAQHLLRTYRS